MLTTVYLILSIPVYYDLHTSCRMNGDGQCFSERKVDFFSDFIDFVF